MISAYELGATLYVPATRMDIDVILQRQKYPNLKSVVLCLEDSVPSHQVACALQNLKRLVAQLQIKHLDLPLIFIRPRHLEMAHYIIDNFDLSFAQGFVLPKFDLQSLIHWQNLLEKTHLLAMPTLETHDCFQPDKMGVLADTLMKSDYFSRALLVLRIGGNDLLRVMGMRRPKNATLYETPLGYVLKMLSCQFRPVGFSLTAPVCELIHQPGILQEELKQDITHGFVGKTAIHPTQIEIIQEAYGVEPDLYQEAQEILNSEKGVFKMNGAMCEPATHIAWARNILLQVRVNGVKQTQDATNIHAFECERSL